MLLISAERAESLLPLARLVVWLLTCVSIFFGTLAETPTVLQGFYAALPALAILKTHLTWLLPSTITATAIAETVRRKLEAETLWPVVKSVLDNYRTRVFGPAGQQQQASHHHRVTLFKHCYFVFAGKCFLPPRAGWMKICCRSGHADQAGCAVFHAPAKTPDQAEGIAGTTWAFNGGLSVEHLPDVSGIPGMKEVEEFAKKTYVSQDYVRESKPKSRSYYSFPIEVKSKPWGVIVVDSRSTSIDRTKLDADKQLVAQFLTKVLERMRI